MGRKGEKQFRWTKPMEHLMLEILADEVKQGNKSTNAFKAISFNRVSDALKKELGIECTSSHVENRLRTIRSTWNTIQNLLNRSGLGWDDNFKMITASPKVYSLHIQANPAHEKLLNKKIDMFEEMSLVCGKDRAKGDCAKSFDDIDLEASSENHSISANCDDDIIEGSSKGKDVLMPASSNAISQDKASRKRSRSSHDEREEVINMSTKLGEVASALSKIANSRLDVENLYNQIMAIEGFEQEFLATAFDHLVQNEMLAKAFVAKSDYLRKLWLGNFKGQH